MVRGVSKNSKKRMVRLWNNGMTAREIQEEHYPNETVYSIRYWISVDPDAIKKGRGGSHNAYTPLEDWKVWWLYNNTNLNSTEVGELVNRSKSSVCCRMTTAGTRMHPPFGDPPKEFEEWLQSQAPLIVEKTKPGQGGVLGGD